MNYSLQMLGFGRKLITSKNAALQAVRNQSKLRSVIFLKAVSTSACKGTKKYDGALPMSEIPGPMKMPLVGNVLQLHKAGGAQNFNQALLTLEKEYGKIFKLKVGSEHMVCISDPDMIEDVYRNEGKYPRREKTFPAWDKYHKKHNLPIGVFVM